MRGMGWLLVLAAAAGIEAAEAAPVTRTGHLNIVTIDGSINPASSDYLQKAIARSSSSEGAPPPIPTGCAAPMLDPGAIAATFPAMVMKVPAEPAQAPWGAT